MPTQMWMLPDQFILLSPEGGSPDNICGSDIGSSVKAPVASLCLYADITVMFTIFGLFCSDYHRVVCKMVKIFWRNLDLKMNLSIDLPMVMKRQKTSVSLQRL